MIDGLKVIAWITGESLSRLESGGNDSRGTVPVHVRHSRVAYRGLMLRSEVERLLTERDARIAQLERERDALLEALTEVRDRLVQHPEYAQLTEDEEQEIGGDAAEFSYLARVATDAIDAAMKGGEL